MTTKHALYVALLAAAAAFAIAFAYPAFNPARVLWYYPLEHRWAFELEPSGLAMDWYGRTLLASAVSLGAFGGAYGIGRRWEPLGPGGFKLWAILTASAVLLAASVYVYQLAGRNPTPEPLPPGYVPR